MAKNYSNKNRKRKALIAMLCALSVTCTGLAAACAPTEEGETPSTAVTAKDDTQLLKNGNFEHFDIPDKAIHLIKNVNSWTLGGGTSVKSGIIGTSKSDWDKLTDDELADKLNLNNDLSSDSEDYVNYNNMRSRDILYKDTYAATLADEKIDGSWITKHDDGDVGYFGIEGSEADGYTWNGKEAKKLDGEFYIKDDDGNFTKLIRKELIANPGTHYGNFREEDGKYYYGNEQVYADDKGNYYLDDKLEKDPVGNVLMIHNGSSDADNKSLQQYYTSNTVSLEAHTSAEISLWVKTSDLRFNKGYLATAEQEDKGAYIEVIQSVASKTVDSFKIKAINTQNIISEAEKDPNVTLSEDDVNNGWVKYTVYVNACDFANTSIQLRLGLGGSEEDEKVTGYAFFDDVQVKKYRELEADETECTYKNHKAEIETNKTSCTLTSEEEEKIFYTDVTSRNADKLKKGLHPYHFHYLIDLASIMDSDAKNIYSTIDFGSNVEVGLTTEKDSKDNEYAAAKHIDIDNGATISGVGTKPQQGDYKLPKDVKERPTKEDIIKVLGNSEDFGKYSKLLDNVTGDNSAPKLLGENVNNGNTLLMFSAWGAPYTATLTDNNSFTLPNASADGKDGYLLVSFWVKTSDMDGNTAATAKIYELNEKGLVDEDSVKTLTIDTTDKTTDFEDDKDIYNGWVQCFFFVKNDAKDKKEGSDEYAKKTFYIDFSFGTTSIISTTSYESGFAAFANLQVLKINEDIYNLASDDTNTATFSFTKETEKDSGTSFDKATGTYDVNNGIALPDSYKGANADKVSGPLTNTANKNVFVDADEKLNAGLINKDAFNDETSAIVTSGKAADILSFFTSTGKWENAFGENCYQPLIIINNLREYASSAKADKDTFDNGTYYTYDETTDTYKKVEKGDEFDEDKTYYSFKEVVNYGFIGNDKTVSANGREVISVRVKVTGDAEAYIYLVDNDTDELFNFTTPSYTFWYDVEGNVLDTELDEDWTNAEHREHIVYTLREDGLYDGKDGKLYGNLYNLVKSYKDSKYEQVAYYYEDGKPVEGGYDYVEKHDGETFYKADGTVADHYLCATDGTHVYEYIDGKYYYVEITKTEDKTTETTNLDKEVNNFNTTPRYTKPEIAEELFVKVTKDDCDRLGDNGWVTVNFVISAGSEAKGYHLELWSGARDEDGVENYDPDQKSAVAFDYVHGTVSASRLAAYEAEIINAYNRAIIEVNKELSEDDKIDLEKLDSGTKVNINSYKKLLEGLTEDQRNKVNAKMTEYGYADEDGNPTYAASYYTYTLYDSAAYVPFNATTAGDGETGYDYDASSFSEKLAYFEFEDQSRNEKNIFVDYSAVDQSISKNTVSDDEEPEEEENTNSTELGLYISSIVLVVVLLITLVSILVTQYIRKKRKTRGAKNSDKNVYRKRDRYVKKLHLVKDEMVEPENDGSETEVPDETPDGEDKE